MESLGATSRRTKLGVTLEAVAVVRVQNEKMGKWGPFLNGHLNGEMRVIHWVLEYPFFRPKLSQFTEIHGKEIEEIDLPLGDENS